MSTRSSAAISNPFFGINITEKLGKTNHAQWKAQVLYAIRGACLEGHITGKKPAPASELEETSSAGVITKKPNPAYGDWYTDDQLVLGLLFSTVGKEAFAQIVACSVAAQAWSELEKMFSTQTRAKTMNVRLALTTTRKGNMSMADYFTKMRGYADELVAAGKRMEDEELAAHICNGLDGEYNPVVTSITVKTEPITISDLYVQLLNFETRLELQDSGGSVNVAVGIC